MTRRGNIEAQEIAERIVHHDLIPDLILVSPAERAWSTAEIVANACEIDTKHVQCARELYLATPEATWRLVVRRDPACRHMLICGHNPGLSQVASRLGPSRSGAPCRPADSRRPCGSRALGTICSPRPPRAARCTILKARSICDARARARARHRRELRSDRDEDA